MKKKNKKFEKKMIKKKLSYSNITRSFTNKVKSRTKRFDSD